MGTVIVRLRKRKMLFCIVPRMPYLVKRRWNGISRFAPSCGAPFSIFFCGWLFESRLEAAHATALFEAERGVRRVRASLAQMARCGKLAEQELGSGSLCILCPTLVVVYWIWTCCAPVAQRIERLT